MPPDPEGSSQLAPPRLDPNLVVERKTSPCPVFPRLTRSAIVVGDGQRLPPEVAVEGTIRKPLASNAEEVSMVLPKSMLLALARRRASLVAESFLLAYDSTWDWLVDVL